MKILFINHMRDMSGWAQSAIDTIFAMDSVGIDVVPRCVNFAGKNPKLPARLLELEQKDSHGCDIVWQNILPEYLSYDKRCGFNICSYFTETDSIPSVWAERINTMDLAVVHTTESKRASERGGVTIPIQVLPVPIDITKFYKTYPSTSLRKQFPNDYLFLCVAEWNARKGWEDLIKAFHVAFAPEDAVQLVIKTSIPGKSSQEASKIVADFCNEVKTKLRLYPTLEAYKQEILIMDYLPDEVLYTLYNDVDCYVTATRGEGWCIPAFDAMGFRKPVIAPCHTSFEDYFNVCPTPLIECRREPCYGEMGQLPYLHTARENWWTVDIDDLVNAMQFEFRNPIVSKKNWHVYGADTIPTFNYNNVGAQIKNLLEQSAREKV